MAKNWIAGAIKNPGALHRDLGIPEGEKIPLALIKKAAKRKGLKIMSKKKKGNGS